MIRLFARVHLIILAITASVAMTLATTSAFAAGSNMPWEEASRDAAQRYPYVTGDHVTRIPTTVATARGPR